MKRLILFFSFISALTLQLKAQLDYNAWPLFFSYSNFSTVDSVAVLHFSDSLKIEKYPCGVNTNRRLVNITTTISATNGRLLFFSNGVGVVSDSSGKISNLRNFDRYSSGGIKEGMCFRDNLRSDTIYNLYVTGWSLVLRKTVFDGSVHVISEDTVSSKYAKQTALTRNENDIPIIALGRRVDTLASPLQYVAEINTIDLFTLENGNLILHSSFSVPNIYAGGSFEFSPDGETLIVGNQLFQVNRSTKQLSNQINLQPYFNIRGLFGTLVLNSATFSENSRYLYVRRQITHDTHDSTFIIQFDLNQWDETAIKSSAVDILADSFPNSENLFQIQLAPDGKIYGQFFDTKNNNGYLAAIKYPNRPGLACEFVQQYYSFNSLLDNMNDSNTSTYFPNISLYRYQPIAPISLGTDTVLCQGDSLLLKVDNPNNHPVIWSTGDTISSLWVSDSGQYSVSVFHPSQTLTDTITIQFAPRPTVYIGPDTAFCDLVDYLIQPISNGKSFSWNTGDTSKELFVDKDGRYVLTVRSQFTCTNADTVQVDKIVSPAIRDLDTTLCEGEQLTIGPSNGQLSYSWSTGDTSAQIIVQNAGIYSLLAKNQLCEKKAVYTVSVIPEDSCSGSIYFPNAFTPNGDGYNQSYTPKGNSYKIQRLTIYNRWGQVVYDSNSAPFNWDGTYKGVPAPEGVYFYTCTYTVMQRQKPVRGHSKGNIHLLR